MSARPVGLVIAAVLGGLALVVGSPAPRAVAASDSGRISARLAINPETTPGHSGHVFTRVTGTAPMSLAGAQQMLTARYKIKIRFWGEDLVYDDLVLDLPPFPPRSGRVGRTDVTGERLIATARGLEYAAFLHSDGLVFDEDPEGEDEIYAGVRLLRPDGATARRRGVKPGQPAVRTGDPLGALPLGARRVQADGRGLALERHGRSLLEVVAVRAEGAQRGLGDEHVVAGQSRGGLDAGRCVHRSLR